MVKKEDIEKKGIYLILIRTYTSALEKHILQGSGIPKPYFLGLQRSK